MGAWGRGLGGSMGEGLGWEHGGGAWVGAWGVGLGWEHGGWGWGGSTGSGVGGGSMGSGGGACSMRVGTVLPLQPHPVLFDEHVLSLLFFVCAGGLVPPIDPVPTPHAPSPTPLLLSF